MLRTTITERRSPRQLAKFDRAATKGALQDMLRFWVDGVLPRHFEEEATAEYQYRTRNAEYEAKKRQRLGHRKPLVNREEADPRGLERTLLSRTKITGTAKRATVHLRSPSRLDPQYRNEIKRVSERDSKELKRVFRRAYAARMKKLAGHKVTRIR